MKIVIDIDEGLYEWVHRQIAVDEGWSEIQATIMDGTPLPKGHGRLIDCTQLHMALDAFMYGIDGIHEYLDNEQDVPTIIEADREDK